MIIICPNCSARYLIQTSSIGPEGKKVKCASCKNVWHQEPEQSEVDTSFAEMVEIDVDENDVIKDEVVADEPQDADVESETEAEVIEQDDALTVDSVEVDSKPDLAIPSAVRPDSDEVEVSTAATQGGLPAYSLLVAIFIVFLAVIAIGQFPKFFTSVIPGMEVIYEKAGFEIVHQEELLTLDQIFIQPDSEAANKYSIEGVILNLSSDPVTLPVLKVQPLDRQGVIVGEPLYHVFETPVINAETSQAFNISYQSEEKVDDFELRFVIDTGE